MYLSANFEFIGTNWNDLLHRICAFQIEKWTPSAHILARTSILVDFPVKQELLPSVAITFHTNITDECRIIVNTILAGAFYLNRGDRKSREEDDIAWDKYRKTIKLT